MLREALLPIQSWCESQTSRQSYFIVLKLHLSTCGSAQPFLLLFSHFLLMFSLILYLFVFGFKLTRPCSANAEQLSNFCQNFFALSVWQRFVNRNNSRDFQDTETIDLHKIFPVRIQDSRRIISDVWLLLSYTLLSYTRRTKVHELFRSATIEKKKPSHPK